MKRVALAAAAIGLCAAAFPAWAQANGGGNPCLMDVNLHANGIVFGAGADLPVPDNDCWRLERAKLAALFSANAKDQETARLWGVTAREVYCSIPDNSKVAVELCGGASPVAQGGPPAPAVAVAPAPASAARAGAETVPVPVIAVLSERSCVKPAGVPASEWTCYSH